ncbi:MAG: right-handed parallel beta-helix repeat-containing protein [Lautropia sp.]
MRIIDRVTVPAPAPAAALPLLQWLALLVASLVALLLASALLSADARAQACEPAAGGPPCETGRGCIAAPVTDSGQRGQGDRPGDEIAEPRIRIGAAGIYCLSSNLTQRRVWDWHAASWQPNLGDVRIVRIGSDDVTLDLRQYTISNQWTPHGMPLIDFHRGDPARAGFGHLRSTLRNGTLISPGPFGGGIQLRFPGLLGTSDRGHPAKVPPDTALADVFPDTRHLIENLTIHAGRHAIVIDGRNNVIRNNRLIVDGETAIIAIGPGTVIEDNDIEVRGQRRDVSADAGDRPRSYPIRLILADGAIVRNNRIRFAGAVPRVRGPAAIQLRQSQRVVAENNRAERVIQLVDSDLQSTHRAAGNTVH